MTAPAQTPTPVTPIRRLARNAQRGMTLLEIMIVLAILALVMGFLVGPKVMAAFGGAKIDIAKDTMKKYVYEAYPQWSAHNPSKACPGNISELYEYMNDSAKDPWGHPYTMLCGDQLPAGAKGLAITSDGPDGKAGSDDDLRSWDAAE